MWRPVGPLPAVVYWRRRCVALASAALLAALVLGTAGTPAGAPVPAAIRSPAALPSPTAPGPATRPAPPAAAAEGARDTTVGPTSAGPTARTTTPGAFSAAQAPDPTTERLRPDDTPRPSVAAAPATPVPPSGPVPCTNAMLTAAAELDRPVHRVGSRPVLRLVVANVSGQPCVRDLDSARQEIVVWSQDGAARLWSSNDCVNASSIDLRTLVPGRPVVFAVTWGERTTTPGCRPPRTPVPAGSYRLMVRLDDLISPPTPFIRTP